MTARRPHRPARLTGFALAVLLAIAAVGGFAVTESARATTYTDASATVSHTAADSTSDPATRFAVGSPAMTVAQQIAAQYWGMNACNGDVTITWTQLDPDINAQSTWDNPVSAYDNPDQNTNCQIQFNPVVPFDWPMFCTVTVHEYGHLTGHPHVQDPNNVMNPYYVKPLAQCAQTPDPSAPPAPAPVVKRSGNAASAAGTHRAAKPRHHRKRRHHHKRRSRRHRRHHKKHR